MNKICPLMVLTANDKLIFQDIDIDADTYAEFIKEGAMVFNTRSGGHPKVDILRGTCKEADCAWWNTETGRCCMNR